MSSGGGGVRELAGGPLPVVDLLEVRQVVRLVGSGVDLIYLRGYISYDSVSVTSRRGRTRKACSNWAAFGASARGQEVERHERTISMLMIGLRVGSSSTRSTVEVVMSALILDRKSVV